MLSWHRSATHSEDVLIGQFRSTVSAIIMHETPRHSGPSHSSTELAFKQQLTTRSFAMLPHMWRNARLRNSTPIMDDRHFGEDGQTLSRIRHQHTSVGRGVRRTYDSRFVARSHWGTAWICCRDLRHVLRSETSRFSRQKGLMMSGLNGMSCTRRIVSGSVPKCGNVSFVSHVQRIHDTR